MGTQTFVVKARQLSTRLLLGAGALGGLGCGGDLTAPTTGSIGVATTTTGPSPDPDGYTILLDGAARGPIGVSGSVVLDQLVPGPHQVGLSGLAANCQLQGDNPRSVTVSAGGRVTASFNVSCATPPPTTGTIEVTTATTGSQPDPDGYTVSLDGAAGQPIGVNATLTISAVASGTHAILLAGLAPNCSVQGANPQQVTVAAGQTATVSFAVSCSTAELQEVPGQVPVGYVEIQGVGAGPFNPSAWQQDKLNWVPDVRSPMFAPLTSGPYQNIYAPWPLEGATGWRLFYGGWDGSTTPNDRVYSVTTGDFLTFDNRTTVIEHGAFMHVNNVNVQQLADGSLHMICTVYPDQNNVNKPAYFSSPDGITWNGSSEPYAAQLSDIVDIQDFQSYQADDFNGANVLLRDDSQWTLYLTDWNSKTYRATGDSPPTFHMRGVSLASEKRVNDVKKFVVGGQSWYLMGLHLNTDRVWFSLSNDGVNFSPEQTLFTPTSAQDLYIVALGFVTKGNRVLGALYGASAVTTLDQNRIFARWLQKKVVIADPSSVTHVAQGGFGPDRQWFQVPPAGSLEGTMTITAEDGFTPLGSGAVSVKAGKAYRLILK